MKTIIIISFVALSLLAGCASHKPYTPPVTVPDDREVIPKPNYRDTFNDFTDFFDKQFTLQAEHVADLSRHIRTLFAYHKEAYNVDPFGEVANSSWFTNRNAINQMSIEDVANGPNSGDGPDTGNQWTIIRAKMEGVTVGFTIVDNRNDTYVIKFDPIGFSGLNSGSEVIGSKIFHAVGFNVPENYVAYFDPKILKLGEAVEITDDKGRKRLMTNDDLKNILSNVQYEPNGTIRSTASKYVEGKILGPFKYESTRQDDPNDLIPHQHRRELRGLRVIGAWVNHIDAKAANSMDTYIEEDGSGYVRHYLIDFGTILGSGGRGPQPIYRGHENEMDPKAFLLRMITLGLYVPEWEKVTAEAKYPCVGRYFSEYFNPMEFKPIFPNPAYDNLTPNDGYWGAKQVMSFTDEQLNAIVDQAQYPDQEAADYLLQTLIERRDITGRYWFNRIAPLDNFEMTETSDGEQAITFVDMAVETALEFQGDVKYRYKTNFNELELTPLKEIGKNCTIVIPEIIKNIRTYENVTNITNQLEIDIQLKRLGSSNWSNSVKVYLSKVTDSNRYEIIGIQRLGR